MPIEWDDCIQICNDAFEYMCKNFDKMCDKFVKNMGFRYTDLYTMCYYNEVADKCRGEIEEIAHSWICKEFASKHICEKDLWTPFYDAYNCPQTYFGYKKLFLYISQRDSKQYYFQLVIHPYDGHPELTEDDNFFNIALYGWKEENDDRLHPIKCDVERALPLDGMMLDVDWAIDGND